MLTLTALLTDVNELFAFDVYTLASELDRLPDDAALEALLPLLAPEKVVATA